ncbi:hypothetical protein DP114_00695 [Brasilonema sennae CENA114]|uniref:Uncharacterized protein n=1 Tax=Brasilonema sennae CENA114 TaxID=415709 RepID=A0A856M7B5_9CYAN|nr:hypothetical protein DP114_00695 [Brasilonema sennae CENA114]
MSDRIENSRLRTQDSGQRINKEYKSTTSSVKSKKDFSIRRTAQEKRCPNKILDHHSEVVTCTLYYLWEYILIAVPPKNYLDKFLTLILALSEALRLRSAPLRG